MNVNASRGNNKPAKVWILQPEINHYGVAVWDEIINLGGADGAYTLKVNGTLSNGGAFGGGERDYFVDCPLENFKRFGIGLSRWPTVVQLFKADKPDVLVMYANPRNIDCWRIPKLCRQLGIPVIMWSKVHSYSRFAAVMKYFKPHFFSRFDYAVCYGESSREELLTYRFPADRIYVANNTIDTRRIFSDGARIIERGKVLRHQAGLDGKKVLLCIGRMDPEKRHMDLLKAWPQISALDKDFVLVIVSGGPLLQTIREKAKEIDAERIIVTGRVPEGDDYAWISTCDIGIYPGAVGLAINISLAFAKPTIIADEYGADSEILLEGVTGWRFKRGDLADMSRVVGDVLRSPEKAARICENARVLMRDKITIDNMARNVDKAIRAALIS